MAARPSLQGPMGFSFWLITTASGSMARRCPARAAAGTLLLRSILRHREFVIEGSAAPGRKQGANAAHVTAGEASLRERFNLFGCGATFAVARRKNEAKPARQGERNAETRRGNNEDKVTATGSRCQGAGLARFYSGLLLTASGNRAEACPSVAPRACRSCRGESVAPATALNAASIFASRIFSSPGA